MSLLPAHLRRGAAAEESAHGYLEARGLRPVARNVRTPHGELDLIMRDGNIVVFVEVRYRATRRFGLAQETVGAHKQSHLIAAAQHWLQDHPRDARRPCRFDVVAMHGEHGGSIEWLKDAFAT